MAISIPFASSCRLRFRRLPLTQFPLRLGQPQISGLQRLGGAQLPPQGLSGRAGRHPGCPLEPKRHRRQQQFWHLSFQISIAHRRPVSNQKNRFFVRKQPNFQILQGNGLVRR